MMMMVMVMMMTTITEMLMMKMGKIPPLRKGRHVKVCSAAEAVYVGGYKEVVEPMLIVSQYRK
jgi:hypothetical protein